MKRYPAPVFSPRPVAARKHGSAVGLADGILPLRRIRKAKITGGEKLACPTLVQMEPSAMDHLWKGT